MAGLLRLRKIQGGSGNWRSEFSGTSKIGVSLGIGDVLLVRPSTTRLGRDHVKSGRLDAICTSGDDLSLDTEPHTGSRRK